MSVVQWLVEQVGIGLGWKSAHCLRGQGSNSRLGSSALKGSWPVLPCTTVQYYVVKVCSTSFGPLRSTGHVPAYTRPVGSLLQFDEKCYLAPMLVATTCKNRTNKTKHRWWLIASGPPNTCVCVCVFRLGAHPYITSASFWIFFWSIHPLIRC